MSVVIDSISKQYANGVVALRQVSLAIDKGMFGLLGPNGAGKTTLMKIMTTLIPPTSGSVSVMGYDVVSQGQAVRQSIGYLPQHFGLYAHLTGREFLDYVACLKNLRQRGDAVAKALEAVSLVSVADRRVGTYSGGMKQRLGIAQAILGQPSVLIVDEPTVGLDPAERIRFRNLLAELSAQRVVILSTHIVGDIERSCQGVALLSGGRLVFCGSPQDLRVQCEGRVWELTVDPATGQDGGNRWPVVSTRYAEQGLVLRVLADTQPAANAHCVESSLEDAYLYLLGSDTR